MDSINKNDNFVVFNSEKMVDVESWPTKGQAMRACHVLNTHELSNLRRQVYRVFDKQTGETYFNEGLK